MSPHDHDRPEVGRRGRETSNKNIISENIGNDARRVDDARGMDGSCASAANDSGEHGHTAAAAATGVNSYEDLSNFDDGGDEQYYGDADGDRIDDDVSCVDGHESNSRDVLYPVPSPLSANTIGSRTNVEGHEGLLSQHKSSDGIVQCSNRANQCKLGHAATTGNRRPLHVDESHRALHPHARYTDSTVDPDIDVLPTLSRPRTHHGRHEAEGVVAVMLPLTCGGGRVTRAYGPHDTILQFITMLRQDMGVDVVPEGARLFTTSPRRELSDVSRTFGEAGILSKTVLHLDTT